VVAAAVAVIQSNPPPFPLMVGSTQQVVDEIFDKKAAARMGVDTIGQVG